MRHVIASSATGENNKGIGLNEQVSEPHLSHQSQAVFDCHSLSLINSERTTLTLQKEIERKIRNLMKIIEEKDSQIASLKNMIESQNVDATESSQTPDVKDNNKGKTNTQESHSQHSTSIASLSVQQLQDMITNSIRAQYGGSSQNTILYSKPYSKRIDNLRMPVGYQPPKFQHFDGKGNPK
ncbi:uncharacterized protein LOC111013462 [Momordica charantia]|uniref:Uncharacterized protein LOC111013462 n=1 Tax=Momordica charantia TaxID=3673 RepID=A0A6J1CPT6_MOMCH|nr:uncharacterized protein LOC111013462 [Momordica charantia]